VTASTSRATLVAGDLIPDRVVRAREEDAFRHSEIAARVAELITVAEPPLNVALFGPWGSGKSSFAVLLKEEMRRRSPRTAFITYDAWKYSGEALQRSFLARVSEKLDVEGGSDLRHEVERNQVDLKHVDTKQLRALCKWGTYLVLPFILGTIAVATGLVALMSWAANKSVRREILRVIPTWLLGPAFVAGLLALMVKLLLDTATVKVREPPPVEEEFEARFTRVLGEAAEKHKFKRFVFFIDELDRVSSSQVVEALQVIRNFLDQPETVFVVAADEEVIERALKRSLRQATPINEDEPYYSSASEFVDKIFQHQIDLPPLRGQRLTAFARDLVVGRGGLWGELRSADENQASLNSVLYALIPSHVRSPRRVKVLLNNFATNSRIAESRGIEWLNRAAEIAKLTVFQTEFPRFAADLHREPRLPALLLDPNSSALLSQRTRRLLEHHRFPVIPAGPEDAASPEPEEASPDNGDDLSPTDALLVEPAEEQPLISTQRENLRRYLQSRARIPDPGRDLLYLEAGGAAEGLDDPALGELIESEAVENPPRVADALRGRPESERQRAVAVIAGMALQEFGEERTNVIDSLFGVAEGLRWELGPTLADAAFAVTAFADEEGLADEHLVGALLLGFALRRATRDPGLRDRVLGDERLLANEVRTRRVAEHLDEVDDEDAVEAVCEAIARFFDSDNAVLTDPIASLSPSRAEQVLRDKSVGEAVRTSLSSATPEQAREVAADLVGALVERKEPAPQANLALLWPLLRSGVTAIHPEIVQLARPPLLMIRAKAPTAMR
jgi:KAP family P-loop domain